MRIIILVLAIWSCQAAKEVCLRPDLKKGFFVPHRDTYKDGDSVSYGCDSGLKPALETWWGQITCSNGIWSHTPRCIEKTWCIPPHVPNAQTTGELDPFYTPGSRLWFKCNVAYEFEGASQVAVCEDGKWNLPTCKRKRYTCDPPLRVDNGMIKQPYQDAFEHGHRLDYVCAKGYKISGQQYSHCNSGRWTNTIKCEKITCRKPQVQYTEPEELKFSYDIGETIRFRCRPSYEFEGSDTAECVDGSWRLPVCRRRGELRCNQPSVQNGRLAVVSAFSYAAGISVQFVCDDGYEFEGTHYAQCNNGQWKLPVCKRAVTGGRTVPENKDPSLSGLDCGPRPLIENGDFTELPGGNTLQVQCKFLYKRVGPETVTCVSGVWSQLPVCKPPCKLDRTRFSSNVDVYLPEGEKKDFYCTLRNYNYYYTITIQCTNGQAIYGACG